MARRKEDAVSFGGPRRCEAVLALVLLQGTLAGAEVVESSPGGFLIRHTVRIAAARPAVYRALVSQIGAWWHPEHTFSGDARNLSMEARPNGCFCESLPDGGGVRHMSVVYVEPGATLRLSGALGPFQKDALIGAMSWELTSAEAATDLTLSYAVGGYRPAGLAALAVPVDSVLAVQIRRLKNHVEGAPLGR